MSPGTRCTPVHPGKINMEKPTYPKHHPKLFQGNSSEPKLHVVDPKMWIFQGFSGRTLSPNHGPSTLPRMRPSFFKRPRMPYSSDEVWRQVRMESRKHWRMYPRNVGSSVGLLRVYDFLTFMIEDWWAVFFKEILFFSRTFLKERHQTSKIFSTSLMPLFSAVDDSFVHKGCTKLAANFSKRKHWCPRDPWDWIIYLYMISVNNGHVQWEMEVNNPFPWILWDGTFRCFLNKKTTSFSKRTAMPKLTNSMCLRKHPEKKSW